MLIPRFVIGMASVAMIVLGAGVVFGQDYPNKSIRIVTGAIGGGSDFVARMVAQGISGPLGQPVLVDNRGGSTLYAEIVSNAPPNGYTLVLGGGSFWIGPLIRKMIYDPVGDFSPITLVANSPIVLVVHPSLPVKSVKELITYANAKPGQLNNSAGSTGGSSHLAGELFKSMAGVNIVRVRYTSGSQEIADLLSGQVQLTFTGGASVAPHIKSGKLRALAVTSTKPSTLFPDLPTVAATLPGYESAAFTGMLAPAKTPDAIIKRLNQEVLRFLKTAEGRERLLSTGAEAVGSSPAEFAATIKSDMTRFGKLIKDAGIREE